MTKKLTPRTILTGVIIAVIILLLIALIVTRSNHPTMEEATAMYYAKSATLTSIDTQRNRIGLTDIHGDEWFWYCDTTMITWKVDDVILLVMYNNGTHYSYDDDIVSLTKEGIISETLTK